MKAFLKVIPLIRFFDGMVFLGPPLIGIIFSIHSTQTLSPDWVLLGLFIIAIYLMAIHVFLLNDIFDLTADAKDINKQKNKFKECRQSSNSLIYLTIFSGILPLILMLMISFLAFTVSLVLLILSVAYSTSLLRFHGKVLPWFSSLLHVAGGTFSFILGYILIGNPDIMAFITGLMFGFFIAGGHLFQEIQDNVGDKLNGMTTTTVHIGVQNSAILGLIFITIGHIFIGFLINVLIIPVSSLLNASVFITTLILILITLKKGLQFENMKRLRNRYRIVYAIFWLFVSIKIFYSII